MSAYWRRLKVERYARSTSVIVYRWSDDFLHGGHLIDCTTYYGVTPASLARLGTVLSDTQPTRVEWFGAIIVLSYQDRRAS